MTNQHLRFKGMILCSKRNKSHKIQLCIYLPSGWHIEAETHLPPFSKEFSWIKNSERKQISLKYVRYGLIEQHIRIGLDNGQTLDRWQVIIRSNNNPVHRRIYVSRDLNFDLSKRPAGTREISEQF